MQQAIDLDVVGVVIGHHAEPHPVATAGVNGHLRGDRGAQITILERGVALDRSFVRGERSGLVTERVMDARANDRDLRIGLAIEKPERAGRHASSQQHGRHEGAILGAQRGRDEPIDMVRGARITRTVQPADHRDAKRRVVWRCCQRLEQ